MNRLFRTLLLLAGTASIVLAEGCNDGSASGDPSSAKPTAAAESIRVETVLPQRRTTVQPAQIEPLERVEVVAKIAGYLKAFSQGMAGKEIDIGSRVKAGQVLAVISVPELEKEVKLKQAISKEAAATVQAAMKRQTQVEKELGKYQAEFAYWEEELGRYEGLRKRDSIEKSLLDSKRSLHVAAKSALEGAEAKVAQVKADLLVAQAHVETAQYDAERVAELYGYATVRAPAASDEALYVVTRRWADPGAFLQPGTGAQQHAIVSLMRIDVVKVVVEVPELDVAHVEAGDSAIFEPAALPGQKFEGGVTRFAAALSLPARTMRVEIDLPNAQSRPLYPGMYGTAVLSLGERKKILLLPARCVHKDGEQSFVYCVANEQAEKVPVAVGATDGAQVEILSGLREDRQVIRVAHGTLQPGRAVAVIKK